MLDSSRSDWWLVSLTDSSRSGWVPADYLEKKVLAVGEEERGVTSPGPEPFHDETGEIERVIKRCECEGVRVWVVWVVGVGVGGVCVRLCGCEGVGVWGCGCKVQHSVYVHLNPLRFSSLISEVTGCLRFTCPATSSTSHPSWPHPLTPTPQSLHQLNWRGSVSEHQHTHTLLLSTVEHLSIGTPLNRGTSMNRTLQMPHLCT